jgi:hypothetical protein
MKPVRGLRGPGPTRPEQPLDTPEVPSTDAANPAAEATAAQVQRLRRRDELFDDIDEPADEDADQPVVFARASALAATQKITFADRSLEAFRSADISALIDRLAAASAAQATRTVPALDVLRRLKRLMEMTERRRNAARPTAGPPPARDGLKRRPPAARPERDEAASGSAARSSEPAPGAKRAADQGAKARARPDKDRPL